MIGGKMRKKVLMLMNGSAGTGMADQNAFQIVKELTQRNCEVTVYPIIPAAELTAETILVACDGRFDVVACCGGDGTLNHVINGMMMMDHRPPLGYIPSGSTNDFAKSIGIPRGILAQCETISRDHVFAYDIGCFNDTYYFNYIAAFGAFTSISYDTSQIFKNAIGHAAYMLKALLTLPQNVSYRCRMHIEHDGETEDDEYLFGSISNARSMAGFAMPFSSSVDLSDGLFEVMLIKAPPLFIEVQAILATLLAGKTDSPYIKVFQTDHVHIKASENTAWTWDGEYGGTMRETDIHVEKQAIALLLPPKEKAEAIEASNQPIFPE